MNKHVVLLSVLLTVSLPAAADSDDQHYQANKSNYITHEQAAQAAVAKVGSGVAEDVDFEYSKRRGAYFEVEVRAADGSEHDVRIDAKSGKVLSVQADY